MVLVWESSLSSQYRVDIITIYDSAIACVHNILVVFCITISWHTAGVLVSVLFYNPKLLSPPDRRTRADLQHKWTFTSFVHNKYQNCPLLIALFLCQPEFMNIYKQRKSLKVSKWTIQHIHSTLQLAFWCSTHASNMHVLYCAVYKSMFSILNSKYPLNFQCQLSLSQAKEVQM